MEIFNAAEYDLLLGDNSAYDWKYAENSYPPNPVDQAHRAARGILENFRARRDIGPILETFNHDIRVEIVSSIAAIIRKARLTS